LITLEFRVFDDAGGRDEVDDVAVDNV